MTFVNAERRMLACLAKEVSRETFVNLMDQYRPCCRAGGYPDLDRPVNSREFGAAIASARRHGLKRAIAR